MVYHSLIAGDGHPDMLRTLFLILGLCIITPLYAAGGGGDETPDPYLELAPDFVVNIGEASSEGRSYVKAEVTLRFHDADTREKAEDHEPWLRHEMVMLLSGQSVDRMRSPDGQEKLRKEARVILNERLGKEMPEVAESVDEKESDEADEDEEKEGEDNSAEKEEKGMIREVLFPNFIVQTR